jgi:hypothetical protein
MSYQVSILLCALFLLQACRMPFELPRLHRKLPINPIHCLLIIILTCRSIPPFNVADILSLAIDHLKVAWITADLAIHVDILALIGQLFRDGTPNSFRPFVNQLLAHVLRVLNICCCIVRGELPPNYKSAKVMNNGRSQLLTVFIEHFIA